MPASPEANLQVVQELRERESALFFPVSIQPLNNLLIGPLGDIEHPEDPPITKDSNNRWQVVKRDDTGEILAIHKDQYRLHTNEEVFTKFDEALGNSNLDLRNMTVRDEVAYNGGRSVRTYRFPSHRVSIDNGDDVDLMLKLQNSYDGSRRFGMNFGAFRILCSNGLVIGDNILDVKAKHTDGLDIAEITDRLGAASDVFLQTQQKWTAWRHTNCPDGVPDSVLGCIPGISDMLKERIYDYFVQESQNQGSRNLWALYNALTRWSTHEEVKSSAAPNIASIQLGREEKVRKALEHPIFQIAA